MAAQVLRVALSVLVVVAYVENAHAWSWCVGPRDVCSPYLIGEGAFHGLRLSCGNNYPAQYNGNVANTWACNIFKCNCEPCCECDTERCIYPSRQQPAYRQGSSGSCDEHAKFISAPVAEKSAHLGSHYCAEGWTISEEAAHEFEHEFAADKGNGLTCEEFQTSQHPDGEEGRLQAIYNVTQACFKMNCSSSPSPAGCGSTMYCSPNQDTCKPKKGVGEYCNHIQLCETGSTCVSNYCQPGCSP